MMEHPSGYRYYASSAAAAAPSTTSASAFPQHTYSTIQDADEDEESDEDPF